jgi:response regulator RpfG family c-di-GMP phosphodiesterase
MEDHKPRILVVDDEEVNIRFLTTVLQRRGYEVLPAYDGAGALEQFHRHKPDLVLLDVMMPGMDGFEVCRRIKDREETHFVPIIIVTALDTTEDRIQGIEAGVDDFLSKPIQIEELLARVRICLKNRQLFLQLENSYKQIAGLTEQTDQIIQRFDPLAFDFFSAESMLFKSLIQIAESEKERPSHIILGVPTSAGAIECRIYKPVDPAGRLDAKTLTLQRSQLAALRSQTGIFFSNFQDGETIWSPPANLLNIVGSLRNLVVYDGERILLGALNYGRPVSRFDAQVLKGLALHYSFFNTIADQTREIENSFRYMIDALARASHANDEDTGTHILRIKAYTALLAGELGLSGKEVEVISNSALMHDVGKIHIHPDILRKEEDLSEKEREIIKKHTVYGAMILGKSPRLAVARNIALYHHERWDGTGYPEGLRQENIPLEGRIVAICDVYDALRSRRPYKAPFDHPTAVEIITTGDGRTKPEHFDPQIWDIFRRKHMEFEAIYDSLREDDPSVTGPLSLAGN